MESWILGQVANIGQRFSFRNTLLTREERREGENKKGEGGKGERGRQLPSEHD